MSREEEIEVDEYKFVVFIPTGSISVVRVLVKPKTDRAITIEEVKERLENTEKWRLLKRSIKNFLELTM